MGVQDFVRWILPKEDQFFYVMTQQADVVHRAALALAEFKPGGPSAKEVATAVQKLEHEGDRLLFEVEQALARTFVTPIDREDIQRAAARLDDVVDKINLTARSMSLYGVEIPTPAMVDLMRLLIAGAEELHKCVAAFGASKFEVVGESARAIKTIEKEGDSVFRDAVANLFRDETVSAKELLRNKEVLEDLEEAIDLCEDTAEFLATLAVKHA